MPTQNFKVGEMLNKRTRNSKTWINFDGSYTTDIHSGDIHFEDENGNLQNINTDLFDEADFDIIDVPVAKEGKERFYQSKKEAIEGKKKGIINRDNHNFQGLKVPFDCHIPRNFQRGYTIGKGQDKLTFKPVKASPSKGYLNENDKSIITYQDVWNDTDVELKVMTNGIKETILLKTDRAPFSFSFEVDGPLEDDLTAGELKLMPAWLEDGNGERRDVTQTVRRENEKTYIDLIADVSGLTYPIEIDPTVNIKDVIDWCNLYEGGKNQTSVMTVRTGGDLFIKFDLSFIQGNIESATLNLYKKQSNSLTDFLYWGRCISDWDYSTITWENKPDSANNYSRQINTHESKWEYFDVTEHVSNFVNEINYGWRLYAIDSEVQIYFALPTDTYGYAPILQVSYNVPPTAPTVIAPNGAETWNSLHTVSWDASVAYHDFVVKDTSYVVTVGGVSATQNAQSFKTGLNAEVLKSVEFYIASVKTAGNMPIGIYNTTNGFPTGDPIELISFFVDSTGVKVANFNAQLQPNTVYAVMFGTSTDTTFEVSLAYHISSVNSEGNRSYRGGVGSWTSSYSYDLAIKLATTGYLQYQIQLTTDEGANWKDIIPLTTAGATSYSYDFINEVESSLCKIRVRAFDGSSYGPWDESDGVFTIVHNQAPTAPTNLSPNGITLDRASNQRFSWQHNDPNTSDPQSKFDLQWRLQGTTTWYEITQVTVNQFYDFVANNFPRGTIEWRVRTYDQAGLSSPYSDIAAFIAGDKPAQPTIVSPGTSVAVANPTVQWSSDGQTGYSLAVKDSTSATVFSSEKNSANKAETITYDLANQQNYTIELKIKNVDGLYSDIKAQNISVSYTPPAIPDIETIKGDSFIQINITDPVPSGTQPTALYHDIYKEIDGKFVRIATNVSHQYKDYHVASGEQARYFVRTFGDNNTFSDTITFTDSITLIGVWLHIADDPENSVNQFKWDGGGRSSSWGLENSVHKFQGRKNPVIEIEEMEDFSVDFNLSILDEAERKALERIIYSKKTICYRDGRGRKVFSIFTGAPLTDEFGKRYSTNLSLLKIDFSEEV